MKKVVQIIIITLSSLLFINQTASAKPNKDNELRMDKDELKAIVDTIKARKISFKDFKDDYSFNDTANVIINIFFDKQDNSAIGQMSFLPITLALTLIPPPIRVLGAGLTLIAFPLFLNGAYTMHKFRKKKLLMVLIEYKKTGYLPGWVRKKANNMLAYYENVKLDY